MQVTVTFDPTQKAMSAAEIAKVLRKQADALMSSTTVASDDEEPTTKRGKKAKLAKTVSEDEDEDFGTEGAVEEEEIEAGEEESDDDEDANEGEEDEEEELSWDDLKSAINKYGNKNADGMKAILLSFNIKSTKELQGLKKKWEPVYRKVMAKLKKTKKAA